jgi:integrase
VASIKKQPDGTWRYRIRYKDNGIYKEKSKTGFLTKGDCKKAANELEKKINNGLNVSGRDMNVEVFLNEWLKVFKKPNVKNSTYMRIEREVRIRILPHFGGMKLSEITRMDGIKWVGELSEKYARGTVLSTFAVFHDALNVAVYELNYLDKNVLDRIKIPVENTVEKPFKFFEKRELTLFLTYLKENKQGKYEHSIQYYTLFHLLARTGLRLGEALALTWDDINGNALTVNKTLSYDDNNNFVITTPKTKSSNRTIRLLPETVNLLKGYKVNDKECVLKYQSYHQYNNYIFHSPFGHPMRAVVARDYFKQVCKNAGVPILSPNALRHSHAVHLLEAGADIKTVSARLGHASTRITADVYVHATKKLEDISLSKYEDYI